MGNVLDRWIFVLCFCWISSSTTFFARAQKPGDYCNPEGSVIRRFGQYYTCKDGRLELSGCLSEYDTLVPIGHAFSSSDYDWNCNRLSDQWVQMSPIVCWYKGKGYLPDEVHVEKPFYFTCKRGNGRASFAVSGCVNSYNDEKILPGQNFQSGSYIYSCRSANGSMRIEPAACIYDNKEILLNDELVHPHYAFTCKKRAEDGGIEFVASSCVYNGKKYTPGKQYVKGHFIFQCHQSGNRLTHEVVGCVDESNRWYSSGERWIQGNGTLRYVTECNINGGRAMKMVVQCLYQGAEGSILLNPGCMKKFGEIMLLCNKLPAKIEFRVFLKSSETVERNALKAGYKYC